MVKKLIVFLFVVGMGIGSLSAQLAKAFCNMPILWVRCLRL